jgi:uncharacterized protein (TIGR03790 family)
MRRAWCTAWFALGIAACGDSAGPVLESPQDAAVDIQDINNGDDGDVRDVSDTPLDPAVDEGLTGDVTAEDTPPDEGVPDADPPPPRRDLLVVYQSGNNDSEALARYYIAPETGRNIHADQLLGIRVPEVSAVDRATYEDTIRRPIADFILASGGRHDLKYIVLMKGIPHQILGENEFSQSSTFSSVDSELCTLFSEGRYPVEGQLFNGPRYNDFSGGGFFRAGDGEFRHQRFTVSSQDRTFYLDYLVGRIDGYTYGDARAIIDRSLRANAEGGWVVFDSSPGRRSLDTMVDPVWPLTDPEDAKSGEEMLTEAGISVFADTTALRLTGAPEDGLPAGAAENVIAYAGWGVNHTGGEYAHGARYILDDLQFTWRPGAAWVSYESFNGTVLDGATLDENPDARRNQGQVGDFLSTGGTVAIGNVWEPFSSAVGDERVIFYRYVVAGDPWIEAAYKGLRYLSWQEIVLGDPLCTLR